MDEKDVIGCGSNQIVKKSAELADITVHVSYHGCIHSFASRLFECGTVTKKIQSIL